MYRLGLYDALASVDMKEMEKAYNMLKLSAAYKWPGRIFVCGNGGSAAIAEHFSCDHSKGVRAGTFLTPDVISLSSNMAVITAIANDISYEEIFARQLSMHRLTEADTVVVISSSGKSPNIVEAYRVAGCTNSRTIAMVGFDGGRVANMHERWGNTTKDALIHVKCDNYGLVEDSHQIIMHALAQALQIEHKAL